jgi:hypothetical protein
MRSLYSAILLLLLARSMMAQTESSEVALPGKADLVQLFSFIDRPVATVGQSLVLTVEMLASPKNDSEAASLEGTFKAVRPELPEADIDLVRAYEPVIRDRRVVLDRTDQSSLRLRALHMQRRFVIRPKRDGLLEIPGISMTFRDYRFETAVHQLHVYRLESDFLSAQRAVLPLLVESRHQGEFVRRFVGTGSGFIVADDALVTAYHVVVNAHHITATLPNGRHVSIKKVWVVDPRRDIAILQIDPGEVRRANVRPLRVAPRQPVNAWQSPSDADRVVFTAGWPGGIQRSEAGVLFHASPLYADDAIWLSSNRVRPGDSGGPLIDRRGRVIGVVSYGMSAGTEATQLLEYVATATDPRPALVERFLVDKPQGLGAFRDDDFYSHHPVARAVKDMAMLTEFAQVRRRVDPAFVDVFLRELDSAVNQSYDQTRLHFLQGSIYQMLGDFDNASVAYEEALVRQAEHYPAAYSLAYCRLALRSYDAAADLFDFSAHFEPYRDLAEYGLAQAKMQLLDYDEAIYHLRRIIHRHEDFAPAFYLLGRAYIGKGSDVAAAMILVKLYQLRPAWGDLLERSIRLSPFRPVTRTAMGPATIRQFRQIQSDHKDGELR